MELFNGVDRWPRNTSLPLVLALGNFDGVHRGHQAIIKKAVEEARERGGAAAALIFDPHPALLLRPKESFSLLTDIYERALLMDRLGLDYLVVERFTDELASLTPEQFVRLFLLEKLRVCGVVVGSDYSFGRGGTGRAEEMLHWGRKLGFTVTVCPLVFAQGTAVSSSLVRALIRDGAVRRAAELLDYFFFRRGRVTRGSGIGKKMVYPTANCSVSPGMVWPGEGVYLTAVGGLDGELRFGVTNVGPRPTFARRGKAVETHILDFQGDIYHREVSLFFLEKLRDTRAFRSPEELRRQVEQDIARGKELIDTEFKDLWRFFDQQRLLLFPPLKKNI